MIENLHKHLDLLVSNWDQGKAWRQRVSFLLGTQKLSWMKQSYSQKLRNHILPSEDLEATCYQLRWSWDCLSYLKLNGSWPEKVLFFSTLAYHSWNPFHLAQTGTHSGRCIFICPAPPHSKQDSMFYELTSIIWWIDIRVLFAWLFKLNFFIVSAGVKVTLWWPTS